MYESSNAQYFGSKFTLSLFPMFDKPQYSFVDGKIPIYLTHFAPFLIQSGDLTAGCSHICGALSTILWNILGTLKVHEKDSNWMVPIRSTAGEEKF